MLVLAVMPNDADVLRRPALPVDPEQLKSREFQRLVNQMIEELRRHKALGLAAPQVHQPWQLFVYDRLNPKVIVNPRILERTGAVRSREGCLSLPAREFLVPRAERIVLEALDRKGSTIRIAASGTTSLIFQHETDHLHGKLISDIGTPLTKSKH